jgi:hypothetical protein
MSTVDTHDSGTRVLHEIRRRFSHLTPATEAENGQGDECTR